MKNILAGVLCVFIVDINSIVFDGVSLDGKMMNYDGIENLPTIFIVSLRKKKKHFCGGSLISVNHILSAATCVVIIQGENNLLLFTALISTNNSPHDEEDLHFKESIYHRNYIPSNPVASSNYDIGLILLRDSFININATLLGFSSRTIYVKDEPKLILWSPNPNLIPNFSPHASMENMLRIIDLVIECPLYCLRNDHHKRSFGVFQMCASQSRTNSKFTKENAGSPLLIWNHHDNTLEIVGIFSISSYRRNYPFSYGIRVSAFEKYINMKMNTDLHPKDFKQFLRLRERPSYKRACTGSSSQPHQEANK